MQLCLSASACPLFIAAWEECGNYYCFNGGTCVNETCQCAEGFGGEYCLYSEFPVYTKLCHDFIYIFRKHLMHLLLLLYTDATECKEYNETVTYGQLCTCIRDIIVTTWHFF